LTKALHACNFIQLNPSWVNVQITEEHTGSTTITIENPGEEDLEFSLKAFPASDSWEQTSESIHPVKPPKEVLEKLRELMVRSEKTEGRFSNTQQASSGYQFIDQAVEIHHDMDWFTRVGPSQPMRSSGKS
jgi:hypothetical protein